jgi:hypothetical protein
MAPIGVPDEEAGAGTMLLVETMGPDVVGEPLLLELWPPVLEDGVAVVTTFDCVKGMPVVPVVGS